MCVYIGSVYTKSKSLDLSQIMSVHFMKFDGSDYFNSKIKKWESGYRSFCFISLFNFLLTFFLFYVLCSY